MAPSHLSYAAKEHRATMVTPAITLLLLMGFSAIAIDGSNLYRERGNTQSAADLAALAAADEKSTVAARPTR